MPKNLVASAPADSRFAQIAVIAIAAGLFGVWGMAQWLYNEQFQQFAIFFSFTPVKLAWTLSLFNIAYFMLAIPAALFHRHFGFKLGLLLSLSLFGIGAFLMYFAIIASGVFYFLAAIVTLGSGWALLETCLNPLAVEAGLPQTAILRLNLVQVLNAVGLVAGCYLAQKLAASHYYLSSGAVAQSTAHPYVIVGLASLLLAFVIEQIPLPASTTARAGLTGSGKELSSLLRDKGVLLAAAALAAYCLTLTVVWSATYQYRMQELGGREFDIFFSVFFWFFVGRVLLAPLMRWIAPVRLLMGCAIVSLAAVVTAFVVGGMTGWICLLVISCLLSITYPTVFAATIVGRGTETKLVTGTLVAVAGLGSAIGPLFVTPALNGWPVRTELLLAAPFVAIILVWTLYVRRT